MKEPESVNNIDNVNKLDPNTIHKYTTELNLPTLLTPENKRCCDSSNRDRSIDRYNIKYKQISYRFHPNIPITQVWSYTRTGHPALIEIERNRPIIIKWINGLPTAHLLAKYIDHTLGGAQLTVPDVRNVVHVHGGEQTVASDGSPIDWYTPGQYTKSHYPNKQPPTMLIFHDHALGITRLNVYAGLTSGIYMIRDPKQEKCFNLPKGEFEIPLALTDRSFFSDGSLAYNDIPSGSAHPIWSTNFLGDVMTVNNGVWPYLKVKRGLYRFRIVNTSDTRTYELRLTDNLTEVYDRYIPTMIQIGSDGGYLPKPIKIDSLLLSSGERADILINFSKVKGEIFLINTANAPYPSGSPPNDNMKQIMKIIVECSHHPHNFGINIPKTFKPLNPKTATVTRFLTLRVDGSANNVNALYLDNSHFMLPVTERPILGTTEIWEFINLSNGVHPMHVHLIQFQLYNRQKFNVKEYIKALDDNNPDMKPGMGIVNPVNPSPYLIGDPVYAYGTNEYAWKDTIRANGGEVTRIIVRFSPQKDNTYFPFDATVGAYMWHCHILSHEDNDMMRPFRLFKTIHC